MKNNDIKLIEAVTGETVVDVILNMTEEVIIYRIEGKHDWDNKYPYRIIYYKNAEWVRESVVSPNFEIAYLTYLGSKYCGPNTDFVVFATRMLKMDTSVFD